MRKNFEIQDLLTILHASKHPMNSNQIAEKAKTQRNRVNPFLKMMVTAGQAIEVKEEGKPAVFSISETGANELLASGAPKPAKPAPKSRSAKDGKSVAKAAQVKSAPKAQPLKPGMAESNVHPLLRPSDKAPAAPAAPAAPSALANAPAASANVTPIDVGSNAIPIRALKFMRQLVANGEQSKSELAASLGPVDDIIEDLRKNGLITQEYIISDWVYTLTPQAYLEYPVIAEKPLEVADVPADPKQVIDTASASAVPSEVGDEPAAVVDATAMIQPALEPAPTPASAAVEEVSVSQEPVIKAPEAPKAAQAQEPEAQVESKTSEARAPLPASPALEPAAAIEEQGDLPPVLGDISREISTVVERIFKERVESLVEQLHLKTVAEEESRKTIAQASEVVDDCIKAFEGAITALSSLSDKLKNMS